LGKREFTSFDVAAVVRELRESVTSSRVNNVYQLDGKTVLLKLYKSDQPALHLILGAGRRLHLTSYAMEKPETPPAFCMALRKYLRNAWLTDLVQHEFERTVVFSFKTKASESRLVLELFGDGNIILVGEDKRILQALGYRRMRDRNVLRGESFSFAPSIGKNPLKTSEEEMFDGLKSFGSVEIVRAVARFLSIGGAYAEESLLRARIDKTKPSNMLSENEVNAVFSGLRDLISQVFDKPLEPSIVLDGAGSFVDVVPFKLRRYEGDNFRLQSYSSFNEALDEFYARTVVAEKAAANLEDTGLRREAERLKRVIADQERVLVETEGKAEEDKHIGDVIYAHGNELQLLLDRFLTNKQSGRDWKNIVSEVQAEKKAGVIPSMFFESFDTKSLLTSVCVEGLPFSLDIRVTIFENAARFYERGKRTKQRLAGVKTALEDSRRKLTEVETKICKAEAGKISEATEETGKLSKLKVKRKEWFEKFRWFVSSEGFLVVAGKDATSNEVLIKKYARPDDIVFHADIVGAPFVVVKTEGKHVGDQVLREAAEYAAAYSRGWKEGFGSVDVYWIKPEQLSKTAPSGEYVAHGAFMVSGKREWFRSVALRVAVGIVISENGEPEFFGGPVEAVKARSNVYVPIVPGVEKDLFSRVLAVLAGRVSKEHSGKIRKFPVGRIREIIPYGIGRMLEKS